MSARPVALVASCIGCLILSAVVASAQTPPLAGSQRETTEAAWQAPYEQARRLHEQAATNLSDPSNPSARAPLAEVMRLAQQALAAGVPADRLAEVHQLLGVAALEAGQAATAVTALRAAVAAAPRRSTLRLTLGLAYEADGRSTLAVRLLREVLHDAEAPPAVRAEAAAVLGRLRAPVEALALEPTALIELPGLRVRHHPGEPFAAQVRQALTEAQARLARRLGLDTPWPVEVVLFHDAAEYRAYHARADRPRPEWSTACAAYGRIFTYPGAATPDGVDPSLVSTLTHEYTHVALRAVADDRALPCWLDEGLALLLSEQFGNCRQVVRAAPALINLRGLLVPSFAGYPRDTAYLAYAQSRAMVEDLLAVHGPERLRGFLTALGRTAPGAADEAFRTAFGRSMESYLQWWVAERADG